MICIMIIDVIFCVPTNLCVKPDGRCRAYFVEDDFLGSDWQLYCSSKIHCKSAFPILCKYFGLLGAVYLKTQINDRTVARIVNRAEIRVNVIYQLEKAEKWWVLTTQTRGQARVQTFDTHRKSPRPDNIWKWWKFNVSSMKDCYKIIQMFWFANFKQINSAVIFHFSYISTINWKYKQYPYIIKNHQNELKKLNEIEK